MAKNPRTPELDDIDAAIVRALIHNGRASNRQLATLAGVAESTAHTRLRSLETRGVIVGYEAVISPTALGNSIQALIGVSLRAGARQAHIEAFTAHVRRLPEVTQFFFVGGGDDFVIHIAVADSASLRQFVVEEISGHESVASTRTSIIFDYGRSQSLPVA
ncbi:DNA-binding Lrp family transcriptional regulator [Microbacterium sp. AG1240]|uniref:Lrp/AsnC family transcriptional regulator n=1 Tax=Microbacterium sp. AG1240 TaxID=2183992 RepID=UPI000EB2039F|nr:Lrp/AsnC family transcriptional regulator [Microbacterium sp. AG1240]RKT31559.1 DNA-binding Lrp family transcriptional regulator [Microbacterium sp. AG1240]